jgi:epoxyqueuosine reductase
MTAAELTERLKAEAAKLGFSLSGVCRAVQPTGLSRFHDWLAAGYAGEMTYLSTRAEAYAHPDHVLPGVRSLLMLGFPYLTVEPNATEPGQGRVSRYAWGVDYHHLIRERLNELSDFLRSESPGATVRGVIDTAPLLEREFAQLAGLGWIGKNTLLLNRSEGSWFFLATLLTDVELEYDSEQATDHCGTCRACLDACPTGALVAPYVLDSRRCISYLTIELHDPMPAELRPGVGDWLLGCDICQDVCPWNNKAPVTENRDLRPREGMNPVELAELFFLDEDAFRRRFKDTPLWRPRRRGILRNAAIILGNRPDENAIAALIVGLNDVEPLVRGACAWALSNYRNAKAEVALSARRAIETDSQVSGELESALTAVVASGAAMIPSA